METGVEDRRIRLSSGPRTSSIRRKSGLVWRISKEQQLRRFPDADCIPLNRIINITKHLQPGWPPCMEKPRQEHGRSFASGIHLPVTKMKLPEPAKGLECDKFNPAAVKLQFDNWFGKTFEENRSVSW